MAPDQPPKQAADPLAEAVDATRRTRLANERTQLAWWRTGLAALAVAIGVGRVVPDLGDSGTRWPYVVVGAGFAIWGVLAFAYGTLHTGAVEAALRRGEFPRPPRWPLAVMTAGGAVLGLLTAVLILLD